MKARTNPRQSWMALVALGAVAAAYAYLFYLPNRREITAMKQELTEAEAQAEGTVPLVAAIGATQKELDEVTRFVEDWQDAAPSENELSELFERIYELTQLAETETTRFEPQGAVAFETFLRVPVSMECRGSFAQLARLLTGLETMREPIWVSSVEIQATGAGGAEAKAEITLDVFADNLDDSDQENLSGEPITQEADRFSARLAGSDTDT